MEDLKQIAIYYVSGGIDLIWIDEDEYNFLVDATCATEKYKSKWITYRDTQDDREREMWLNLYNIEKIVEK